MEAGVITAPAEFLGDWSSLSGRGVLSYDFAVFFESRGDRPGGSITIAGPGGRAHWEAPRPTGGADWRTRLVPIDEANWVVLEGAWAELLRDVRELRISLPVSSRPVSITGIDNIRVGTPCRTDLDGDGELTIFDFLAFQNAFDAGDPIADFDGDGEFTIFDFLGFQNEFDSGCP
ncbi:MAG: GC-type dockerin domain-anchored protein [Phycisphaerales bacterium JB060]